eukprot:tig00021073_g18069.t1
MEPALVVAVHAGAGQHARSKELAYVRACKRALEAAADAYARSESVTECVAAAVQCLEDNELTNAGVGANLTATGSVELDASIMRSEGEAFGACGAVSGVRNPVRLAAAILEEGARGLLPGRTTGPRREGRRGPGAKVGAVAWARGGACAAAVSSGGLLFKTSGRVGQAAVFGAGCWAQAAAASRPGVACSSSGAGEALVRADFCRSLARRLAEPGAAPTRRPAPYSKRPAGAAWLAAGPHAGLLALVAAPGEGVELLWAHSTPSFALGHLALGDGGARAARAFVSRLAPGGRLEVGGAPARAPRRIRLTLH